MPAADWPNDNWTVETRHDVGGITGKPVNAALVRASLRVPSEHSDRRTSCIAATIYSLAIRCCPHILLKEGETRSWAPSGCFNCLHWRPRYLPTGIIGTAMV